MSINDTANNYGAFSIKLRSQAGRDDKGKPLPAAPQEILDLFAVTDGPDQFLGHVIVTSQAFDPDEVDVLELSRYTGVFRESKFSSSDVEIGGSGLVFHLGDLDAYKVIKEEIALDSVGFEDGIEAILPASIEPGDIVPEIGSASARYLYVTYRSAIEDWLSLYDAEYYITPQGRINAGTPASLFPSYNNPTTFVIRKGSRADMRYKPLPLGSATFSGDATNYATEVVSLVQVEDTNFIEGSATGTTSKRDLHGNLLDIVIVNNESSTLAENVDARAAARLAQAQAPRTSLELSTENYDIHGEFKPGDAIWVYDVPSGLYDLSNEIYFSDGVYWPIKLRVLEITYPVVKGMGVYFKAPTPSGTIYNLTPYIDWEPPGTSQIVVGAFTRSLIPPSSGGIGGVIAPVINPDSPPPIPDPPTIFGGERQLLLKQPTTSGGNPLPLTVNKFDVYASTTSGFTPGPTNYIGYVSVVKGDINLGIDVIKRFQWPEEAQTYVRTSAVNSAGPGPASIEVAVTAGLIPSAAILDLTADKISAGTITASVTIMSPEIYGGIIATATGTGQRVAMEEGDFDRIKFYSGIIDELDPSYIASSAADGNLGLHGPEFSDSGGDNGNINIIPKGGPSAFPHSAIWIGADEVILGQFGSPSSLGVTENIDLVTTGNIGISGVGMTSVLTGDYAVTADHGSIAINATTFDLTHDLGGQVNMDNNMLFMKSPDEFWISGVISDVSILGRAAKVEIMDDTATAYRGIKADGFEHANPPTIAGDGAGNAGLYNLLNALDAMGLIVNTVT